MFKNELYRYKFYLILISTLLNFHSLFSQGNPNPSALIDSLILNEMTDKNLPGVSTVIVKNGKIEGNINYTNLVFIPSEKPFDLLNAEKKDEYFFSGKKFSDWHRSLEGAD